MFNWVTQIKFKKIRRAFNRKYDARDFDMSDIDSRICELARAVYAEHKSKFHAVHKNPRGVGFIASVLYDTGGHTVCLVNQIESMVGFGDMHLYCTRLNESRQAAPRNLAKIERCASISGLDAYRKNFTDDLITLYNLIADDCPPVMFVYIHMWDLLAVAALHLLQRNAGIKIVFVNHASHFPNVGMTLADVILEGMPTTKQITEQKRHLNNCVIIGLQSVGADDTRIYSPAELRAKKSELGIPVDAPLTVTGGSAYKLFDGDKSPYFEMILELLRDNGALHHMVITNLDNDQRAILNRIFDGHADLLARVHIVPMTPEFDALFQCADVFIDSFPIGAAMTQIDLMRMRVASVVHINREKPIFSFHEYMPSDYPYMYDNVADMRRGIEYLLASPAARRAVIGAEYKFWLRTYERDVVRDKYIKIIKDLK